ncbi:cytochrome P450 [Aspergillus aurantiobrunneus]
MISVLVFGGAALAAVVYLLVLPVFNYFYDAKGLRKYTNFSPLSGFTDLRHESPILRTGPNSLSFGDIRAVKDLYGHSTRCIKDLNNTILGGSHTHLWEYKVAYSTQRLLNAMDAHCTDPMLPSQTIPDPKDVTLDWAKWINLFTIEAINNIALSSPMDLLDTGTDNVTAQKMDGTTYPARYRFSRDQLVHAQAIFVWDYKHYSWLAWLSKLRPKWRKMWTNGEPWSDVIYHQAATRLQRSLDGEKLDDFFTSLMEDKQGNPNNLEWGEINAGSDTTAIALTQVLEFLLQHPECLCQLREEVDSVLDEDEVVAAYDKVKNLPYLRACLDEALRLFPPTSAGLPRRTPPEGASIMGEWIPGDTSVSMTIYGTHRDPTIFPDPETYRPARWLDEDARKRMEPYFIPFSAGARGCIGRNVSYLEQTVVLASIVRRYGFVLPRPEWNLDRREAFNLLVGEMPVKI